MSRLQSVDRSSEILLNRQDIERHLLAKIEKGNRGLIGTELELFVTDKAGNPLPFSTIEKVLQEIAGALDGAERIFDGQHLVALNVPDVGDVCLEPGGQIELSPAPSKTLAELAQSHETLLAALEAAAKKMDLQVTGEGHMASFLNGPDMPRSRFAAYYAYCRETLGEGAEDLIASMKSCTGLQVNVDPMGKDFHEIYRAMLLVDLAHLFGSLSERQRRLATTYEALLPNQMTPLFNTLAARDNKSVVGMIVDRLLTLKIPFVPAPDTAEGFLPSRAVFGKTPSVRELLADGKLTVAILDNALSLQMTMPNLRRHGVVETRAPDSPADTRGEVMRLAALYHRYAYDDKARRGLLDATAGIDAKELAKVYAQRFEMPPEKIRQMSIGRGMTVKDMINRVVGEASPSAPARRAGNASGPR